MSRPKPNEDQITPLVLGILTGYLRGADFSKMSDKSGRIVVAVEICLDRGEVPWSEGSVTVKERRNYP